jgi:hypothetical protein
VACRSQLRRTVYRTRETNNVDRQVYGDAQWQCRYSTANVQCWRQASCVTDIVASAKHGALTRQPLWPTPEHSPTFSISQIQRKRTFKESKLATLVFFESCIPDTILSVVTKLRYGLVFARTCQHAIPATFSPPSTATMRECNMRLIL